MRVCETLGCGKPHVARGMCRGCYDWWARVGERPDGPSPRRQVPLAECGSEGAYQRHLRAGETPCPACRAANAAAARRRAAKRRGEWMPPAQQNVSWQDWTFG